MDDLVHVAKLVVLALAASVPLGLLVGCLVSLVTRPNDKQVLREPDRPIDIIGRRW